MTITRSTGRYAVLALVVLTALIWAFARYRGWSGARPAPPPVPAAAPPAPVVTPVKTKKTTHKKTAAKIVVPLVDPIDPAKVRGAKLRDKGEAMGGRAPGRVVTGTATVTTPQ